MKLLFLTKELPYPVNNGHRMRSYHYIKGLIPNNEVLIVCFGKEKECLDGVQHFQSLGCRILFFENTRAVNFLNKATTAALSLLSTRPYAINFRFQSAMKRYVREVIEQNKIDVLVCDGIHQASHVPNEVTCRKILDEHNVESTIIRRFFDVEKNPLKKLYACLEWYKFKKFEEFIWPKFDEIHVCSEIDRAQVEARSGHPDVEVVPNGVDVDKFKPGDATVKPKHLVYTGMIGWKPNEDAVIYFLKEIYPLIKAEVADVTFTVVGKNPTPAIKNLADQDPSVKITGFVDEVTPYIDEAAVYVVPLRIGSGTRLKILEAWAMGKAIVSTSIGCEGLNVVDEEDIVIADDPDVFAQKVVMLIRDDLKRVYLGKNGRKLVEGEYGWRSIGGRINNLISC